MAIEKRKGTTKRYVTRNLRIDGRQKKQYIGRADDPIVGMLIRSDKLADAEATDQRNRVRREIQSSKQIEPKLCRLVRWTKRWKVLTRLHALDRDHRMNDFNASSNDPSVTFPGLQRFLKTCRSANEGDSSAKQQLQAWLDAVPGMLAEATDMIAIARRELITFLAGDSAETKALLDLRIGEMSSQLAEQAGDDPLSRLYADAVLITYFDLLRCTTAAIRPIDETKSAKYWDVAAGRAEFRWIRMEKAFNEHTKRARKARHRKSRVTKKEIQ